MLAGSTVDDDSLAVLARKTKTFRPKILKGYFTQSKIFIFGILMVPTAPGFAKIHENFLQIRHRSTIKTHFLLKDKIILQL